jgi:hypothetical protein
MSNTLQCKSSEPWYKQGWPWFLVALPATAVVAGFITLWIAVSTWDGLVVDDYYQQGKTIEITLARSVRARDLGLAARLTFTAESLSVALSTGDGVRPPPTVRVTIAHPTQAGHDQVVLLTGRDGVFSGPIAPLSTGRWLIQIEDESRTWRLNGTTYLPTETEITILPTDS